MHSVCCRHEPEPIALGRRRAVRAVREADHDSDMEHEQVSRNEPHPQRDCANDLRSTTKWKAVSACGDCLSICRDLK